MQETSQYNDKELLLQVASGDESAFKQLFLRWNQLLTGYVLRITESRELTEEIVQDAFLKIWMTRETLAEIDNFKHYLLVVSRNQAFDVLKKQLREKERHRLWQQENKPELYIAEKDSTVAELSLVDQAISSLPPRRKEVYLLSRHERLSYQQIADQLGISRESVKTHLKLASESITSFIRSHLTEITFLLMALSKNFF
ncbi:RNA polymerase sigma factor [Terrimonas pollutisoli]|uniref:RNA polymerase sigma factor n=1 Tax=Terrimonas pollutisoli TaxID=3034147 RepID=UPI0023ECCF21|nr:sigma-70 family RNA polymerase sigma factor [Terrimonas sp. H1YJ31]